MRLLALLVLILMETASFVKAHATADVTGALNASFVVYSDDLDPVFLGSAFGVQVEGRGVIVTNAHVVKEREQVVLKGFDGGFVKAAVVQRDTARDLAQLQIDGSVTGLEPAVDAAVTEAVFAIGAPLGHEFTVTSGIVSALDVRLQPTVPVGLIRHDAAINPGSSGGVLVNAHGAVLGMNSQIADGSRLFAGIAYAIPVGVVVDWLRGDLRPVPKFGFQGRAVTPRIAAALGIEAGQGVLIDAVDAGGWAAENGLRPGDLIEQVARQGVSGAAGFVDLFVTVGADVTTVTVKRSGRRIVLDFAAPPIAQEDQRVGGGDPLRDLAQAGVGFQEGHPVVAQVDEARGHVGLFVGDRVVGWNGHAVSGDNDLANWPLDGPVLLLVQRDGRTLHVIVDPKSASGQRFFGGNVLDPAVISY